MSKHAAKEYCKSYGLHLPTITNEVDAARVAPFVNLHSDIWLDGTDLEVEGSWKSEIFGFDLHRLPWAVAGKSKSQDCLKYRYAAYQPPISTIVPTPIIYGPLPYASTFALCSYIF